MAITLLKKDLTFNRQSFGLIKKKSNYEKKKLRTLPPAPPPPQKKKKKPLCLQWQKLFLKRTEKILEKGENIGNKLEIESF